MKPYLNLSGNSGISEYEYDSTSITIHFSGGHSTYYRYTEESVGAGNLAQMKQLADSGVGLNHFIRNSGIWRAYSEKW